MNEAVIVSAVERAVGKSAERNARATRPDELAAGHRRALRARAGIDASEVEA